MPLAPGSPAPAFTLPDADGRSTSLQDFAGKDLILFFYPQDDTPGCTKEACGFRDDWQKLSAMGVALAGVSPDGAESHRDFAAKYNLPFTLLSDEDFSVSKRYEAWALVDSEGSQVDDIIRSTVWVGPDGTVRKHWPRVRDAAAHPAEVMAAIEQGRAGG